MWSLGVVATVCDAAPACSTLPVAALLVDGITSTFVFVVWGHVPDAGVQTDCVVLQLDSVEFGAQLGGVADLFQVGPVALDVSEPGLDPGFGCCGCVGGRTARRWPSGQKFRGGVAAHLGPDRRC